MTFGFSRQNGISSMQKLSGVVSEQPTQCNWNLENITKYSPNRQLK